MKKKLILFLLTGFILYLTPSFAFAGERLFTVRERLNPQTADSLAQATADPLLKADFYSLAWKHVDALRTLEAVPLKTAGVWWRLARSHIDQGENCEGEAALRLFELAQSEAEQAVHLEPDNSLAQQTLAVVLGRVALFKGVFKTIGLVKRVHEAALRAAASQDSVPIALFVLGRTHKKLIEKPALARKALGLGWAKEDSVQFYFEQALKVSGGNMIQCCVEFAEFMMDTKKDKPTARQLLNKALELPLRDEQDKPAQNQAIALLKKL